MNIPIDKWNGSDATRELTEKIVELDQASKRQNRMMVRLTWAIAIMTLVMMIGVGVQIWIAIK